MRICERLRLVLEGLPLYQNFLPSPPLLLVSIDVLVRSRISVTRSPGTNCCHSTLYHVQVRGMSVVSRKSGMACQPLALVGAYQPHRHNILLLRSQKVSVPDCRIV